MSNNDAIKDGFIERNITFHFSNCVADLLVLKSFYRLKKSKVEVSKP